MPIEVDVAARLEELARATLEVAAQRGATGVTFRDVAAATGTGSTKRVTNYLPTRSALLSNAVAYALDQWQRDLRAELAEVAPAQQLRAMSLWAVSTNDEDELMRRLFVEMLVQPALDGEMEPIRNDAREHHAQLSEAAAVAPAVDPGFTADVVYLLLRGFYLASIEDPETWTSERVAPIIDRVVSLLLASRE